MRQLEKAKAATVATERPSKNNVHAGNEHDQSSSIGFIRTQPVIQIFCKTFDRLARLFCSIAKAVLAVFPQ
jgi:hypothetical protein